MKRASTIVLILLLAPVLFLSLVLPSLLAPTQHGIDIASTIGVDYACRPSAAGEHCTWSLEMSKSAWAVAILLIVLSADSRAQASDSTLPPDTSIVWHKLHVIGGLGLTFTDPGRLSRRFSIGFDNVALSLNRIEPPDQPAISTESPPTGHEVKNVPRTIYGVDLAISTQVLSWLELFGSAGAYWNEYRSLAYSDGTYYHLSEGSDFHFAAGLGSYVEINDIPLRFNFLIVGVEINSIRGLTGLFGFGWRFSGRR